MYICLRLINKDFSAPVYYFSFIKILNEAHMTSPYSSRAHTLGTQPPSDEKVQTIAHGEAMCKVFYPTAQSTF